MLQRRPGGGREGGGKTLARDPHLTHLTPLPHLARIQLQRFKKLSYRISFPLELKLTNTSDETDNPDRLYSLFAVVVHVGSGPNHGHYISLVRSHTHWLLFDDESVELIDEANSMPQRARTLD